MSVPTAAALKMGVGFPLTNLPGKSDDPNRILSTQCQQQSAELLNECGICKQINDQHCLAKCDMCNSHYHLACLTPPLSRHPKKSKIYGWQCSECDEDNLSGNVQLAIGPRKSRTKYNKDGTIVPVESNQLISNGNDTAESAPNSSSPSSNHSERKPIKSNEANSSNGVDSVGQQATGTLLRSENKKFRRRFRKQNSKIISTTESPSIQPRDSSSRKIFPKIKATSHADRIKLDSSNINSDITHIPMSTLSDDRVEIDTTKKISIKMNKLDKLPSTVNRKHRKEKHKCKERSDRSSSKERRRKRKRKSHDEPNMSATFPLEDGVPKIKIKVINRDRQIFRKK